MITCRRINRVQMCGGRSVRGAGYRSLRRIRPIRIRCRVSVTIIVRQASDRNYRVAAMRIV
jgi:hypothetical protein